MIGAEVSNGIMIHTGRLQDRLHEGACSLCTRSVHVCSVLLCYLPLPQPVVPSSDYHDIPSTIRRSTDTVSPVDVATPEDAGLCTLSPFDVHTACFGLACSTVCASVRTGYYAQRCALQWAFAVLL